VPDGVPAGVPTAVVDGDAVVDGEAPTEIEGDAEPDGDGVRVAVEVTEVTDVGVAVGVVVTALGATHRVFGWTVLPRQSIVKYNW